MPRVDQLFGRPGDVSYLSSYEFMVFWFSRSSSFDYKLSPWNPNWRFELEFSRNNSAKDQDDDSAVRNVVCSRKIIQIHFARTTQPNRTTLASFLLPVLSRSRYIYKYISSAQRYTLSFVTSLKHTSTDCDCAPFFILSSRGGDESTAQHEKGFSRVYDIVQNIAEFPRTSFCLV